MPKLLQINITRNQGSTGKIAEQIGQLMKQHGWEVYVAHGARFINPSLLKSYQIQNKTGEYLHALKSLLFDADGLGSTKATHNLVRFIKEIHPDIIQIHNLHGYYVNYKILFEYLNETNIPIVMTLHDCWAFTGHCVHFITVNCHKWKSGCGNCPQITSTPKSIFIDHSDLNFKLKKDIIAGNKNLHIICVSQWLKQLTQYSIYKNHPIRLIYNGIDLDVYRPTCRKATDKFHILGVSNPWSKDKGLYDIFKLRKILPEKDYHITIVGLNKKQKDSLPIGITGILRTNNLQELVTLYSTSNVFINPTYADTFPTTNLEALACGTPVITYRTGGSPESLSDDTGIVVEKGDINSLAKAIISMKISPLSSKACTNRAKNLFNKDDRFQEYLKLYYSLIKS